MRQEFSARVKLQAYQRSLGVIDKRPHCEVEWNGKRCGKLILGVPEYDHRVPDGLGGLPILSNCQVACGDCHRRKTHTVDRPIMTAADNQMKAEKGIRPVSRPMDGSRNSRFRKRMDGRVDLREIEAERDLDT